MAAYDPNRCVVGQMMIASRDFEKAMVQAANDHDFVKLGRTLARIILIAEHSISNSIFLSEDSRTGEPFMDNMGLPFSSYQESFSYCADLLRKTGDMADKDCADILELKSYVVFKSSREAIFLAKKAIERNPKVGYFYLVYCLWAEGAEGLHAAKRGLKCPNLTSYVRYELLYWGVEHAFSLAIKTMQSAYAYEKTWDEAIAYLVSAYDDAKTSIE